MIGEQMVYTLVMRHRDCDPNGTAVAHTHTLAR